MAQPRATRVDGLTEAKATLSALPDAFREVLAATLKQGGKIIKESAVLRVRKRSGTLSRSIAINTRDDGLQVAVGTPLPHGRFLELGTKRQTPRRWLRPSFRKGARYVRKEMKGWATEAGKKVRFKTRQYKAKPAE